MSAEAEHGADRVENKNKRFRKDKRAYLLTSVRKAGGIDAIK